MPLLLSVVAFLHDAERVSLEHSIGWDQSFAGAYPEAEPQVTAWSQGLSALRRVELEHPTTDVRERAHKLRTAIEVELFDPDSPFQPVAKIAIWRAEAAALVEACHVQ